MHITEIPPDIAIALLRYAAETPVPSLDAWRGTLALARVCRQWRTIAVPIAYSQAFVKCIGPADQQSSWQSNIPLIRATNYTHLVKQLKVSANTQGAEPIGFLRGLVALLDLDTFLWPMVRAFELSTSQSSPENDTDDDLSLDEEAAQYAALIVTNMPRLEKLNILNVYGQNTVFANVLMHHTRVLQRLAVHGLVLTPMPTFSSQLTSLTLRATAMLSLHFACISAGMLRYLEILQMSNSFNWGLFRSAGGKLDIKGIAFASLRHLRLSYIEEAEQLVLEDSVLSRQQRNDVQARSRQLSLCFPQLEKLDIAFCPPLCTLLTQAMFAETLKRIDVHGRADVAQALANLRVPTPLEHLSFEIYASSRAVDQGELPANSELAISSLTRLLHRLATGTLRTSLTLASDIEIATTEQIDWKPLTSLTITSPIKLSVLWRLIQDLPKLHTLIVSNLVIDSIPLETESLIPDLLSQKNKQKDVIAFSVHKSIEVLYLFYNEESTQSDQAVLVVQHLLMGMPKLKHFETNKHAIDMAKLFVQEFRAEYRHLDNTKLGRDYCTQVCE
ncbi:hypothetical protein GGI25_001639 [Coemansia spiralis]|uniref:F-box domain-containing protein n=2 Tax=Coemansia TaxID=4863 RepID=A0A9W8GA87_9FUNG|nr:hypothetical protein EDC05_003333 [Coemansia umbellata]KAJ2679283.1 hypothetical protein GGI25_001639 [Coemansia spiralis]